MRKKLAAIVVVAMLSFLAIDTYAQVRAEYDRGAGALSRQLQRLQTTASVLHTGAHPDDEDSALIAFHARHDHARAAYLSLTRGSGGQNIIGPEQSDLLGVIRTEELLQARRLDGANQFFTRAVDFGFSKHLDEGTRLWDEEIVLSDMVRAIRRFRPTVVVSRWNGTPSDGHGHHQFAGYLTPLAVDAAAEPARFPEQIEEGLAPWPVAKFYVSERDEAERIAPNVLHIDTGERDSIAGRSYFQIGMRGRSQQKSQQMGSLELHGTQTSTLRLVRARVATQDQETNIFAGVDTSLSAIADFEAEPSARLVTKLEELERLAGAALTSYQPLGTKSLIAPLGDGLEAARAARDLARSAHAQRLLDEKIAEFENTLVLAAGITVDALANRETVTPGGTLEVAVRVFHLEDDDSSYESTSLAAPAGWQVASADIAELSNEQRFRRREQPDVGAFFEVRVPETVTPSEPYWLTKPRQQFMYDWSNADDARTEPFARPQLIATVDLIIGGQPVQVVREVQHRLVDRVRGEVRRRIDVVPALSLEPASNLEIVATSTDNRRYDVLLTANTHAAHEINGQASLSLPPGWVLQPKVQPFSLPASPASTTLPFVVVLPKDVSPGDYLLTATAIANGSEYRQTMQEISYPHIETHRVYDTADVAFKVIDVEVAAVHIGYVMGSGDVVPDALRRLGLDVTLLNDETLTSGDLSRFDTIVVGIRASQTRLAYVAANGRLLEFVRDGGTMVVQYQQPDFAAKNLAPYSVSMERNIRVVDETAPVTILQPSHPVFTFPNRIGPMDFADWVQERNNYNFTDFDRDHYIPLTESHDPGESKSDGAMLYAKIGAGHYVYTSYSWFRQLPNGTPGGYRIFANLLSLPATPE